MITVDPFVLEKAPLGMGPLLGIGAIGLAGLWLWFGERRRVPAGSRGRARQRRLGGMGFVFLSVFATVFAFTGGVWVRVSCKARSLEVDQSSLAWTGARAFPLSEVREVVVGFDGPSPGDDEAPTKVLVVGLTNGQRYVLSSGPWKGYGSSERAATALSAAIAQCRPPLAGGK